jgi:hypothetical protein
LCISPLFSAVVVPACRHKQAQRIAPGLESALTLQADFADINIGKVRSVYYWLSKHHMITAGPIEAFFKAPTDPPSDTGDCLLYHLRLDLESLYGPEGRTAPVSPSHRLLATTGILNGIDYLSKAYSSQTGGRKRFVETMQDIAQFSVDDSEALYQLRCALVHQIGLSVVSDSYRKGTRFTFDIDDAVGKPALIKLSDTGAEIEYTAGFWELKSCFREIINGVRRVCETPTDPRSAYVVNRVGRMHSEKLLKQ